VIRIASRKSDLAQIQARAVGAALLDRFPHLKIEFTFSDSLGDKNLTDPLWKMPEKGVFTQDLTQSLLANECDIVVHSWKDLPIQSVPGTEVFATLPRADQRDLLLFKKERFEALRGGRAQLRILSSSPRRAHNLVPFLQWALPGAPSTITFGDVRGNIPTRLKKYLESDADGIVLAKAALDRLLKFGEVGLKSTLRDVLARSLPMILPLKENPTAPGQGALALEVRVDDRETKTFLATINCAVTFASVTRERAVLAEHGGGCHQKIGVSVFPHPHGKLESLRGQTDSGRTLRGWRFLDQALVTGNMRDFFPKTMQEGRLLKTASVSIPLARIETLPAVWIAKTEAWPVAINSQPDRRVWTAGLETWRKLAAEGHWILGSSEGLGDAVKPEMDLLFGAPTSWVRLTHVAAIDHGTLPALGTYALAVDEELSVDIGHSTHFFWTSYSNFLEGLRRWPGIRGAHHSCGPGLTADLIAKALGAERAGTHLRVFVNYEEWRDRLPPKIISEDTDGNIQ
jgi:hydroxymethylbilane synthase